MGRRSWVLLCENKQDLIQLIEFIVTSDKYFQPWFGFIVWNEKPHCIFETDGTPAFPPSWTIYLLDDLETDGMGKIFGADYTKPKEYWVNIYGEETLERLIAKVCVLKYLKLF